jgi:hypothetical protein
LQLASAVRLPDRLAKKEARVNPHGCRGKKVAIGINPKKEPPLLDEIFHENSFGI